VKENIVQLAIKLNLKMNVLKAKNVETSRPETRDIMISQIIREAI